MVERGVSGLPVVDASGRLCGMLSEGDLLRRVELGTATPARHWWSTAFVSMDLAEALLCRLRKESVRRHDRPVVTAEAAATLSAAADLMQEHRIKRLPVVHAGKLVGMISRADFVKAIRSSGVSDDRAGFVPDEVAGVDDRLIVLEKVALRNT